jgi:hypothetical protein
MVFLTYLEPTLAEDLQHFKTSPMDCTIYNPAIIIPYVLVISTGARKTRSYEKTQADNDSHTKTASI